MEPPHLCLVEVEHASSDGGVGEDKGCYTLLRLLKVTDGGHRVEEDRAYALKELQDRSVGSRPLVLQKGVEDGKVGGLNSGSDDQDLSGGEDLKVPSAKLVSIKLISRDTGQHTV